MAGRHAMKTLPSCATRAWWLRKRCGFIRRRTDAVQLHPVRRRSADLYRRRFCNHGGDLDPGDDRAALSIASEERASHRTARPDHLATALRHANERRTAA